VLGYGGLKWWAAAGQILTLFVAGRASTARASIGSGCRSIRTLWTSFVRCSTLQPELDDHFFTVEVEQWVSQYERVRRQKDPKQPASAQALMRMLWRICKRAGVRRLSPHQLRHGFANRFLRESDRDLIALQGLMGHSRPDTTQGYTDEVDLDELAEALDRAAAARHAQASPDLTTLEGEVSDELETLRWRRRESNPRPQSPRTERLQA